METTLKERLIKYLKTKRIGQNKFESMAGISNGYISHLKSSPSAELLMRILNAAPDLNRNWLLTGEGEMLIKSSPVRDVVSDVPYGDSREMLPEYSFQFAAGQTWLSNESEKINRYWYLPDCTDCEAVVQVAGTSMLPNLPPGCYVALKRYNIQGNNPNTIPFGNVFGVVVEDENTGEWHGYIKVLRRHQDAALAAKYWIAHSYNIKEYDDFDIAISQVRSLWIVKQHIVSDY